MRIAFALVLLLASPALAMQHPSQGKNKDQHVCDVPYDPNDIVQISAGAGDAVTIVFGKEESIGWVNVSDSQHLRYTQAGQEGASAVYFKATMAMPPQPLSIRTMKAGVPRDYAIQWVSIEPPPPPPSRVASNADVAVSEIAPPSDAATPCYVVRYTYAGEVDAAKAAQWRAAAAKRKQDQEEIALRQATDISRCDTLPDKAPPECNYLYDGMGDSALAPVSPSPGQPAVFDDGHTTEMHFPGNMPLPIVLVMNRDGKEAQPSGITIEDHGVVKLHSVEPLIRLRDGDKAFCIVNKHYNQVGLNPGTGTASQGILREVRTRR